MSRNRLNQMAQHENSMNRPAVEKSQTRDDRPTHRLYPSLPNTDRYEVCVANSSTGEKSHAAAGHHPNSLLGDTQSEASVASGDVRMKAQILILEEQRQELLSINEKWAKEYHTMVQYYKEKVQGLTALLQHDNADEEMCEGDTLYKKVKDKETAWTGDKLQKAEKEAEELRTLNSTLTRKGKHQHEEIRRLNKALKEALQTTQPLGVSGETLQVVWKHQAEVYKEDFLKERKDREKLKEKCLEHEKKFRKVHTELRLLKSQVPWTPPTQPVLECTCRHGATLPHWEVRQVDERHLQIQRRRTLDDKP